MHHLSKIFFLSTTLLLLLSTFLSSTTALPIPDDDECRSPQNHNNHNNLPQITNCALNPPPALPASKLGVANSAYKLKHIVLGRGTQNYTCASTTSAPVAAGAVATLYDISCLGALSSDARAKFVNDIFPSLLAYKVPIPASIAVGTHYFRDGSTPYFGLNGGNYIYAGKKDGCPAPPEAQGNENGAAVDWLKLVRKEGESWGGVEEVFRVNTAGGRAPATCKMVGMMTVEYVTEYWMYG